MQDVELRDFRLFLEVADTESFSVAARNVSLSQPALSRAIKLMEERLGVRLFDRDTRSVELTRAGREFRPIARGLVRQVDLGLRDLHQFVQGSRGKITVAAIPSLAAVVLPRAVARFKTKWPDVEYELIEDLAGSVLSAVASGRADIGLSVEPPRGSAFDYEELTQDTFGLVCRSDDALASTSRPGWADFAGRAFIAMAAPSSVREATEEGLAKAGVPSAPVLECRQLSTAGAFIARGVGVSAMPELAVPLLGPEPLTWRQLDGPRVTRSIGIVFRSGELSSLAKRFKSDLQTLYA